MRSRYALRFVALGYLALLLGIPVGLVFINAFQDGIGAAWEAVTTPEAQHAFYLTLVMVAVAVPLNTIFGVLAALAIVRQRWPELCALFISGHIADEHVPDVRSQTRIAHLAKPFTPAALREKVSALLAAPAETPLAGARLRQP